MLDSVIYVVSGGAALASFEAAQLMLAEQIRMLTEGSKFSNRNVLATYAARSKRSGHGDCGSGGYIVSDGGSGMLNGEWDKKGIASGDHEFAAHKLNNIDKCWYPDPEYQKTNPPEKCRLYLNQQNQKKSSDWSERTYPTSVADVSITNSQMNEISAPISSLETHVKNQDNRLKRLM